MSRNRTKADGTPIPRPPSVRRSKQALKDIGSRRIQDVLDGRTTAAKELAHWRDALVTDMGGDPSAMELTVLEQAARTKVILDALDSWLFADPTRVINKSKRQVSPVVMQRQKLADALVRYVSLLGLERQSKTLTLEAYVEAAYPEGDGGEL